MKEQYQAAITETGEILSTYKQLIEENDLGGLENMKHRLKANKMLLNALCNDWSGIYRMKKRELTKMRAEKELEYRRKGMTNLDAQNSAKIDLYELDQSVAEALTKRDKIKNLVEDTVDLMIEIAGILKNAKEEAQYG